MPQLGLEVNEGTITSILVQVGDVVGHDQPLLEVETDKAMTEIAAPVAGVVRVIEVQEGQTVPVGAALIKLADSADEPLVADSVGDSAGFEPAATPASGPASSPVERGQRRHRAAPVARRAASAHGLSLEGIDGTGPRGRVTLRDVEAAILAGSAPEIEPVRAAAVTDAGERVELTATRRAIARRMSASQTIPQYHLERDIDASHLLAAKQAQAAGGAAAGVSINDLLIQAIAEVAVRHPELATAYAGDESDPHLLVRGGIDVGLAAATARGLVVPVIRDAHQRGLAAIADDRRRLVELARGGRLGLDDMRGSTITLSSLAAAGVDRFAAMVNPGESTIVAVGRTVERVVPRGRGMAVLPVMTVTMTFDHRVVDGAVGAEALGSLAELVEGGMTWRP